MHIVHSIQDFHMSPRGMSILKSVEMGETFSEYTRQGGIFYFCEWASG